MIARRQIVLAFPVAIAEFQQPARTIEAQPFDDIARPTAAVTFLCQAPLGREHATMAHGGHVTLEVGLAAEQPEPVLDFPLDARRTGGFCFRAGKVAAATRKHDEKGEDENRKHSVCRDQPRVMISMADGAEM